uniref:lysozyme n=1 Tax=Triatoma infestans TaxID=30076 RepID=A0A023F6U5_TRIIF
MNVVLIFFFLFGLSQARVFTRCALARELVAKGIPREDLPNWVCLVEAESSRNTARKGGPNRNGSYDHGLFQINDRYWCKNGSPGGDCNIKCEDLRNDDITDDVKCALKVKKRHGFYAWYGWKSRCKDKPLPSVNRDIPRRS